MDAKRRAGGATISLAWIAGFGWELLLARPPSETLKLLAEIMSPESFYLAMTILGVGGFVYFSWPAVEWVWRIPERRRAQRTLAEKKEREEEQRRLDVKAAKEQAEKKRTADLNSRAVKKMERLQDLIRSQINFGLMSAPGEYAERAAEIEILKRDFVTAGLGFSEDVEDAAPHGEDRGWLDHISTLLPRVRRYGIHKVVDELKVFSPPDGRDD